MDRKIQLCCCNHFMSGCNVQFSISRWACAVLLALCFAMTGCNGTGGNQIAEDGIPPAPAGVSTDKNKDSSNDKPAPVQPSAADQSREFAAKVDRALDDQSDAAAQFAKYRQTHPKQNDNATKTTPADSATSKPQSPLRKVEVRPTTRQPQNTASTTPTTPVPLTRKEAATRLAGLLDNDLRNSGKLKPYIIKAALGAVDPRYELTTDDMKSLSEKDQLLVLSYQRLFTQIGRELDSDNDNARELLSDAAISLVEQIHAMKKLKVRQVKLCNRVQSYGDYNELATHTFLAGQVHQMIVYSELDHFKTKVDSRGDHVVKLTQELVLYNEADGLAVWRERPRVIIDRCRNKRRDFFVVQFVKLSDRLTVGKYLLKVTITDEQGESFDAATVPINIVAQIGAMK